MSLENMWDSCTKIASEQMGTWSAVGGKKLVGDRFLRCEEVKSCEGVK